MRALFALSVWLASVAATAAGGGTQMAEDEDVTYLADMAAPPWSASASEQVTSDHAGLEPCEQVVTFIASGIGSITEQTYTTSPRWGKIMRARITPDLGGSQMLATCWVDAAGQASVVVKNDDGEP